MLKLIVPASGSMSAPAGRTVNFLPVEDTPGTEAARGILRFAEKAKDIGDRELALKRTVELAKGASEYQTELDKKRLELDADPDTATRADRFQKFAQEELTKRTAGMDDETKALFIQRVEPVAAGMELSVRHRGRDDARQEAIVTLRRTNEDLIKKAADAKNPLEREALLAQVQTNIDDALSTKILSGAQHKEETQATLVKADQAAALKMIRDNPGAAEQALKSGKLANLDVVTREKLIDAARSEGRARLNQSLALEARADRIEAKQRAELENRIGKEVDARASDGTLTREYLEQARPFMKKDDYKAGLAVLKGGGTVDDKDTLSRLMPKLDREDISKELADELSAGNLTGPTYRSLINQNRQALKDDGPPSPYKQGYALVNDTLAPGLMFDSSSAKIASASRAQALLEYNTFAEANRDAIKKNPSLATEQAQDIVRRYRLINFDQISSAVGLPQGFAGTRETIALPDVVEAGKRVLEQYDRRLITLEQKNFELRKLDQWEEIIRQRDAANAPKPGPQSRPVQGDGRR